MRGLRNWKMKNSRKVNYSWEKKLQFSLLIYARSFSHPALCPSPCNAHSHPASAPSHSPSSSEHPACSAPS